MKTTQKLLSGVLLACLFFFGRPQGANAQCSANFTFNIGANGLANFYAGWNSNISTTDYFWYSNGVLTYTGAAWSGTMATINYTANGTYTVDLTVVNSSQSCTNTVTHTVNITNASGCILNPSFSHNNTGGGLFNFTSTSTNTVGTSTFSWSYGDGTNGTGSNSSHTYTSNGIYNVALTVSNSSTCTLSHTMNIQVCINPITPSFTYNVGPSGLVTFTSTSTPVNSTTPYYWSIGWGGPTFSAIGTPTATHAFSANGTYTVNLVVGPPGCTVFTQQLILINNICNLNASFYALPYATGVVNFSGSSTGTNSSTTYAWGFGDGGTGTGQNPTHTYTAAGVYNVTLTIANTGSCNATSTYTQNVNVCMMTCGFTYSPGNNGQFNLYSTSTGTNASTNYTWHTFGSQNAISGVNIPTVSQTFTANGVFTVTLKIDNGPGCYLTHQQMVSITNASCTANPNFTMVPTATAQVWNVIPASPSNITSAIWNWGDGSISNGLFSTHTYSASGNYNICLSVTVNCSSTASACATYSVYRSSNSMIQVNVIDPSQTVGLNESPHLVLKWEAHPNPSKGLLNLDVYSNSQTTMNVQVIDINGKLVYKTAFDMTGSQNTKQLYLQELPDGIYILQLEQAGQHLNKKLVISKD